MVVLRDIGPVDRRLHAVTAHPHRAEADLPLFELHHTVRLDEQRTVPAALLHAPGSDEDALPHDHGPQARVAMRRGSGADRDPAGGADRRDQARLGRLGLRAHGGILPQPGGAATPGLCRGAAPCYTTLVAGFVNPDDDEVRALLERVRRIAVVGLSPKPWRDSHRVARYLLERGYEILPVYPREDEILGQRVFRRVQDIEPPVDLVDVFRRSEELSAVIDDALAARAGAHLAAARLHRRAGSPACADGGCDRGDGPLPDGGSRAAARQAVAARLALSQGDCQAPNVGQCDNPCRLR